MKRISILVFALVVLATGSAVAGTVSTGNPAITGSWSQAFYENSIWGGFSQPYNKLVITMVSGQLLADSFVWNTSPAGWSIEASSSGATMTYKGAFQANFYFTLTFSGDSPQSGPLPLKFTYQAFYNDKLLGIQDATWNGSRWDLPVRVPEPSVPLLLIIGGLAVALLAFKVR